MPDFRHASKRGLAGGLAGVVRRRRAARRRYLAAAVLLGAAAVAGWSWWEQRTEPLPEVAAAPLPIQGATASASAPDRAPPRTSTPPAVAAAPREAETVAAVAATLPALDESDGWVRRELLALWPDSILEVPAADLIRRFAVSVDNIADGGTPRKHLAFLAPKQRFRAVEREGRLYIDPASYARYDRLADAVAGLDVEAWWAGYRQAEPLVRQAHRELGYPDGDFDARLRTAVDLLLEVEPPSGPVELRRRALRYEFADSQLEWLAPAQKQLLRMGPRNARKIQAKLRELSALLASLREGA
ncbi:MAG: DUF3014 domain-containing protein [Proteobacteria bacterium]|nr:DUF3014 domain-containing protein [Pseudomonadota bacterium]